MIYAFASPLGDMSYAWEDGRCIWLALKSGGIDDTDTPVASWLEAYFAGCMLPLPPIAPPKTPFQARLREALLAIPFGETRSYGDLAKMLHTAPRALGQALGANPLPVLFPCHRIVGAHGLGGFSCGLAWKKRLLAFENRAEGRIEFEQRG